MQGVVTCLDQPNLAMGSSSREGLVTYARVRCVYDGFVTMKMVIGLNTNWTNFQMYYINCLKASLNLL